MIFFTDENIPVRAARMLDQFDDKHEVRPLVDRCAPGTADAEWMQDVASTKGVPVVVSGDGRILRNKVEKQVLKDLGLRFVFLGSGWTNLEWKTAFAWKIVKAWPDIVRNVEEARHPTIFEVSTGGKVRVYGRISEL